MTIQNMRTVCRAIPAAFLLLLATGTWAVEATGEGSIATVAKATPSQAVPDAKVPAPLTELQQLARCNPFRPIMLAGKPAPGEALSASGAESGGAEPTTGQAAKTDRPPPADVLAAAKKGMVVSAIVSTEHSIYAVIGGKKFFVGDEVAPRVKISKITLSGITVAPLDDAPQP